MADAQLIVRHKIADALYGEVLECEYETNPPAPPHDSSVDVSASDEHRVRVAVKHISLDRAAEMQAAQAHTRCLDDPMQEFRVARAMMSTDMHPNVVYPLTQMIQDGDLYLVFEYCNGGDLFELLEATKASGGLPEQQTIGYMKQIFAGVRFLHEQCGIAHRDLSLENVLLSDGVCKLSDFALSVSVGGPLCALSAGKDLYMAPEVVANDAGYDPVKADIWSLGVMWFILLTGSRLVPLASRADKSFLAFERHGVDAVLRMWGYGDRVSPPTVALLSRMLCIDPMARIDMTEVLTAVEVIDRRCESF